MGQDLKQVLLAQLVDWGKWPSNKSPKYIFHTFTLSLYFADITGGSKLQEEVQTTGIHCTTSF